MHIPNRLFFQFNRPVKFPRQRASPLTQTFFFCFQVCAAEKLDDDQLKKAIDVINRKLEKLYRHSPHIPIMKDPSVLTSSIHEKISMLSLREPFMEILHIKEPDHWLVVSSFGEAAHRRKVTVYDSLPTGSRFEDEVFKKVRLFSV